MYSCFHFLLIFCFNLTYVNVVFFIYFVDVLFPSFAVIPCLFYFSILVHFVYMWLFNCFISVIVWILRMPVSIVIASFGVDCGTWRILFMMLFMIVCIFWLSLCVGFLCAFARHQPRIS